MRDRASGRPGSSVEIRELVLRLPGVDRLDGRRLAEEIAARLAERLPDRAAEVPARVAMRVRIPAGARRDELAALVADQIAASIRGAG